MEIYNKFSQIHFYYDRAVKSHTFRFEIEMTEPVNEDALKAAIKKTLEVFPTIAARPVITADKKDMGMAVNNADPVISHDETPAALGTDESNGYLFRARVSGSIIKLDMFHALMDGRASMLFMTQVLCCYLKELGHDISDAGISYTKSDLSDPAVTRRIEDLLAERGITHGFTDPDAPPREKIYHDPSEEELYEKECFTMTRIAAPSAQVKACTHALGTTPMVLFYVLIAQAMRETRDVGDKCIQCSFAIDLRGRYGSRSQEEFSTSANFYYTPETEKLPLAEQLSRAKAELDKALSEENMLCTVKDYIDQYDDIRPYMDLTHQEMLQQKITESGRVNSSSFFISNVGVMRLPEDMMPYIKDIQTLCTPVKYDPNFMMHTYKDTFYINYFHNSHDETHINRFMEKLAENGINAEKLLTGTATLDYLGKIPVEEPAYV